MVCYGWILSSIRPRKIATIPFPLLELGNLALVPAADLREVTGYSCHLFKLQSRIYGAPQLALIDRFKRRVFDRCYIVHVVLIPRQGRVAKEHHSVVLVVAPFNMPVFV